MHRMIRGDLVRDVNDSVFGEKQLLIVYQLARVAQVQRTLVAIEIGDFDTTTCHAGVTSLTTGRRVTRK